MGYWPSYSKISPDQRANYLWWLAGGRQAELKDVGYAFIYFYGLERRALIDRKDLQYVVEEVMRLLPIYGASRSFHGYASGLISYIFASAGIRKLTEPWFNKIFLETDQDLHEDTLAVALAWLHMHSRPLPAKLALQVARQDSRSPRSVVTKRLPDEFQRLFEKKYEQSFSEGLTLKVSKNERRLEYHPASLTLVNRFEDDSAIKPIPIPDVMRIGSQFKPLVGIWSECIEELKPLSRKAAKGIAPTSREAYEALPPELKREEDHPDKPRWEALVQKATDEKGRTHVRIANLARLVDLEERPKLTMRQSIDLANTAHDVGYYVVPDTRTILRPYQWDEVVAIIPAIDEPAPNTEKNYLAAALMLEIGIAMAAADGTVEKVEVLHVSDIVNSQFRFASDDWRRLDALRRLLIRFHPTLTGIGRRVKKILTGDELEGIGEFLIGVAASNGEIEQSERRALLKAYKSLGIPVTKLKSILEELEGETVEIQPARPGKPGEPIPKRKPAETAEPKLQLNRDTLERIKADTAKVAVLIGEAMGELEIAEEDEGSAEATPEATPSSSLTEVEGIEELDQKYHTVLEALIRETSVSKESFGELVRNAGLMPTGTLDAINDWADEFFDDYLLIEADGAYTIQGNLLRGDE